MSKLKHTRKGQGITIENNISKKRDSIQTVRASPRTNRNRKKNLNYTGNSNFKN